MNIISEAALPHLLHSGASNFYLVYYIPDEFKVEEQIVESAAQFDYKIQTARFTYYLDMQIASRNCTASDIQILPLSFLSFILFSLITTSTKIELFKSEDPHLTWLAFALTISVVLSIQYLRVLGVAYHNSLVLIVLRTRGHIQ